MSVGLIPSHGENILGLGSNGGAPGIQNVLGVGQRFASVVWVLAELNVAALRLVHLRSAVQRGRLLLLVVALQTGPLAHLPLPLQCWLVGRHRRLPHSTTNSTNRFEMDAANGIEGTEVEERGELGQRERETVMMERVNRT